MRQSFVERKFWSVGIVLRLTEDAAPGHWRAGPDGGAAVEDRVSQDPAEPFPMDALAREIAEQGFTDVTYANLSFGIVALHRATKPRLVAVAQPTAG